MSCFATAAAGCQRANDRKYKHAEIRKPCLAAGNRQEMEVKMKTSIKQARNFRPTLGRIAMALTLVSVVGGLSMTPALGKDNDDRRGHRDNGWHNDNRHDNRHDDRYWREHQRVYRPVYAHPYSAPVYVPAPYYPPQPSPGVSLFFPLDIRIR